MCLSNHPSSACVLAKSHTGVLAKSHTLVLPVGQTAAAGGGPWVGGWGDLCAVVVVLYKPPSADHPLLHCVLSIRVCVCVYTSMSVCAYEYLYTHLYMCLQSSKNQHPHTPSHYPHTAPHTVHAPANSTLHCAHDPGDPRCDSVCCSTQRPCMLGMCMDWCARAGVPGPSICGSGL